MKLSYVGGGNAHVATIMENSFAVPQKLEYPAVLLLGIDPTELSIYVHTKSCSQMFITALFVTTKMKATLMPINE